MVDIDYGKLGLVSYENLETLANARQSYLIEDFTLKPSINILVGDSGLGKSALAAQMAMCVASGIPFFGHTIEEPGMVIYCDAEAQPATMQPMLQALSKHLKLDKVPSNFMLWNPNWNINNKEVVITQNKVQLYSIVNKVKPKLVVVDSLRNYYPMSIKEQEHTATMIKEMRKYSAQSGCSWLLQGVVGYSFTTSEKRIKKRGQIILDLQSNMIFTYG
jgi:RecA-family ATPase